MVFRRNFFYHGSTNNTKNDRIDVKWGTRKKQAPVELLKIFSNFTRSVMVSELCPTSKLYQIGVCQAWRNLKSMENIITFDDLPPTVMWISGGYFTFQQDSASEHRARHTVVLLFRGTPDFKSPQLGIWPPNIPDLNPVDCHSWSLLEQRVYRTHIRNIKSPQGTSDRKM